MPWEEVNVERWAEGLGVNINELRQKDRLIGLLVETRKQLNLTQKQLAALIGVSQPRIAQIENRVRIGRTTFDVLLSILDALGHEYDITTRKVREPDLEKVAV